MLFLATVIMTVGELAAHQHTITFDSTGHGQRGGDDWYYDIGLAGTNIKSRTPTNNTGKNEYHNNISPAISAYLWHRIS